MFPTRRRVFGSLLGSLFAAFLLLGTGMAPAADKPVADAEIKAAIVYNLLLFIQWPKDAVPANRFRLCVADDGELSTALRPHQQKTVHGWSLEVHRVGTGGDALDACAAIAIEAGNPAMLARATALSRTRPLLVIAEGASAAERGAMIGLRIEGGRVVFDINTGALAKSGLAASSKLLRLARTLVD